MKFIVKRDGDNSLTKIRIQVIKILKKPKKKIQSPDHNKKKHKKKKIHFQWSFAPRNIHITYCAKSSSIPRKRSLLFESKSVAEKS